MKILIYGRFSSHHFAIRNVITSICKGLNETVDFSKHEVIVLSNTVNKSAFAEMKNLKIDTVDIDPDNAMKNQLFTLLKLPKYIRNNKIDLVIFPQITFYYWKKCKTIFYLHDLIEFSVKNQKSLSLKLRKFFYKRAAKISDKIITVSEYSKKDIHKLLKYPNEKICVLYDGRDENLIPQNKQESFTVIQNKFPDLSDMKQFLLYVGYLAHPQKNLLFVLKNISEILKQRDLYFVLVGPNGKDSQLIHEEIEKQNSLLDKKRIFSVGTVSKDLLPKLYSSAEAFIFVSQYEGFGMPVLEAMSCGCPVITSNVSSLPEVACGCAELIEPHDNNSFVVKLNKILDEGRKEYNYYKEPLTKFTWKKHIEGLNEIINGLQKEID